MCGLAVSIKVSWGSGLTVLPLLKPRPRIPDIAASVVSDLLAFVAVSRAWPLILRPPRLTLSIQTLPEDQLPSPYRMLQVAPSSLLAERLFSGLYIDWPLRISGGVSEL